EEAVPETGDLGLAICAAGIADGNLDCLEAELRSAEDQFEIPERIELPEVTARGFDPRIVGAAHRLGAAQRIGEALRQQPSKEQPQGLGSEEIEEAHRLLLHRLN